MTKPRIAIQVSGLARFGLATDYLIGCWANYRDIDWYIGLYRSDPETATVMNPHWLTLDYLELAEQFAQRLPEGHRIQYLAWYLPEDFPPVPRAYQGYYALPENMWQSAQLAREVNLRRRSRAQRDQIHYDLAVRARLDAGPDSILDTASILASITSYPRVLHTANNHRQGAWKLCDHTMIAAPEIIDAVSDSVVDWDWAHTQQKIPYNTEFLLGYLLTLRGISWPQTDWQSTFRLLGSKDSQGRFHLDPGSWIPTA